MYQQEYINGFGFGYGVSSAAIPDSDYHCENNYEIMYVRNGSRKVFVKENTYRLTGGTLIFIDKNILHKTQHISDKYERFVINFTDEFIMPSVQNQMRILFEQRAYAPAALNFTDKLFVAIFNEWDQLRKGDNIALDNIKCCINLLLSHFIRNHNKYAYKDTNLSNPSVERLVRYINENFKLPITLDSSAKMLHLSPSYLSHIFLKHTGFGFLEYLRIIRLKHGKELLANTNMSVKAIAFECGFNDSNYFSSTFKRETGMSPLQYRKHNI
ncbi:MAG: AraC family transcriptional regulator [Candidatus Ornithomonoglobus sp.]